MLRFLILILALCAEAPGADNGSFSQTLFPILQHAGCPACHNANGVASATRLHFPESGASAASIEAFGYSLIKLVDRSHPEQSLLLRKPTLRTPHTGGLRIKRGSPEEAILTAWIRKLVSVSDSELANVGKSSADADIPSQAPKVILRRLTHSQYNNTVHDLLGDQTGPARQFPSEDFVNGFLDQYDAQNVSPLLEEAYSTAA